MLHTLRTLGRRPQVEVAIGLPRQPRYEHLLVEIGPSLSRLDIAVYLVEPNGGVRLMDPTGIVTDQDAAGLNQQR